MAPPPEAALYTGQVLGGRFEVRDFRAAGGFCLLFEGHDNQDDRAVALKILRQGVPATSVEEFETEARLLERFAASSHVVNIHDALKDTIQVQPVGTTIQVPLPVRYLVLELADASLDELVMRRNSVLWAYRLQLFRDLVKGVHQMHLDQVVHRDVKCENGLVFEQRKGSVVCKVADLGRSRDTRQPARFDAAAYIAGRGDLRFAPPEFLWLQGHDDPVVGRRADTYLLGSVFFELVTGQPITAMALGNGMAIVQAAHRLSPADCAREYSARLAEFRARYEVVFQLFAAELPAPIRDEGTRLLRQLCDPDPSVREQRYRIDKKTAWGLEWLIRRIDIMIARLAADSRSPTRAQRSVNRIVT
jgi:serine/threonine protein kinase